MKDKRQRAQDLERWVSLKREARKAERLGLGAPVEISDLKFLLSQGGQLTQEDAPYIDNCYISRVEVRVEAEKKVYRFNTLTTNKGEFYVPF